MDPEPSILKKDSLSSTPKESELPSPIENHLNNFEGKDAELFSDNISRFNSAESKIGQLLDLEASKKLSTLIFKVLYSFSNSCLHELLMLSRAFRFILRVSIVKKREIFNIDSEDISEGEENYDDNNEAVDETNIK